MTSLSKSFQLSPFDEGGLVNCNAWSMGIELGERTSAYPKTPSVQEWMFDVEVVHIMEDSLDLV